MKESDMSATETPAGDDARIRKAMKALAQAIRDKDVDGVMAHYAPDIVTFDLPTPLQVRGVDAYRKNFEKWFDSVQGAIDYEMRDVSVAVSGDLAIGHYLGHVRSSRKNPDLSDYWVRVTSELRKMNGKWLVTHEHVSMPLNMMTLQAATKLQL
jgi:uncharacterized protein (TIGR02246 family)